MRKTFIYRVYQHSKVLAFFLMSFISLQLFIGYKGVEFFPFLNYGMYSDKTEKVDTFKILQFLPKNSYFIESENQLVFESSFKALLFYKKYEDPNVELFNERIRKYGFLKRTQKRAKNHLFNKKGANLKHLSWLKHYFISCRGQKLKKVIEKTVVFNSDKIKVEKQSKLIWYD